MIIQEFLQYMNRYITTEELYFAFLGLIFIIILFVLGGKEQKRIEMQSKNRKVDELGRIVLPLHVRQALKIEEKDELCIEVAENKMILSKKGKC